MLLKINVQDLRRYFFPRNLDAVSDDHRGTLSSRNIHDEEAIPGQVDGQHVGSLMQGTGKECPTHEIQV
jgi:hypothetical protein